VRPTRILLVDDETNVIAALRRQLRKQPYEILSANSAPEGLEMIKEKGPFAVIVSDYRMPGMDGVEFLSRSQELCPEAARIILTGSNETDVAIKAVNFGNIFRFLLKPVAPDALIGTINAGIEQHRLVIAERDLLAELSILQKIDRELNTSLDIIHTMKTTLEWAIQQSSANAGLIGLVKDDAIQIMASAGYQDELMPYQVSLPLDPFPFLQNSLSIGEPAQTDVTGGGGLLESVQNQTIIPIRRENKTVGVLLLESAAPEAFPEECMRFLTRLCDHASTAITNAELYSAAQAANKAKSEFVSFVSHELRNPITSIGGFTELLASGAPGPINESQLTMLAFIRSGVKRMTTLVTDLSDISRIESGHLRLNLAPTSIGELITEIIGAQQPNLDAKKQSLRVRLPVEPPPVLADRNRLIQIITNLVSNAIKYTRDEGEILLGVEVGPDQWNPAEPREVAHFWVRDNGIGIGPEEQKKVFQKFFRSSAMYATQSQGTGLGLNITKNLVEMQHGQIWFESQLDKGSTFHFTIPIA